MTQVLNGDQKYCRPFKFNENAWKNSVAELNKERIGFKKVIRFQNLFNECRLDLIESLAEYNIEKSHVEKMEPEWKMEGPESAYEIGKCIELIDLKIANIREEKLKNKCMEISNEAKCTLKGDMCITGYPLRPDSCEKVLINIDWQPRVQEVTNAGNGPYSSVTYSSMEKTEDVLL